MARPEVRRWGRVLDDVAEILAGTLSEPWDVVAVHFAKSLEDQQKYLLISTNSGSRVTIGIGRHTDDVVASSEPGTFNEAVERFEFNEYSDAREHAGEPLTRVEAARQSGVRVVSALRERARDATYGPHGSRLVAEILEAISAGRVIFVPNYRIAREPHAEMLILDHLIRSGEWTAPFGFDEDYIGVSKPTCAFCTLFLDALTFSSDGVVKIKARAHHGEWYKRGWTAPAFANDVGYAHVKKAFIERLEHEIGGNFAIKGYRIKDGICDCFTPTAMKEDRAVIKSLRAPLNRPRSPFRRDQ